MKIKRGLKLTDPNAINYYGSPITEDERRKLCSANVARLQAQKAMRDAPPPDPVRMTAVTPYPTNSSSILEVS